MYRYSVDYGNIHFLVMSTEDNFTVGSIQYKYLENDLSKVNKSNTPWIILIGHRYIYIQWNLSLIRTPLDKMKVS